MQNNSICRSCFHSYVCEQFNENRDSYNQRCHFFNDHFVPAADVVEVVRCSKCIYGQYNTSSGLWHCRSINALNRVVKEDDFCSYGERRATDGKKE